MENVPIVETKYGKISGILEKDLLCFRGIRYAKPPIGKLRFAPPEEPEMWSGVYDASRYRTIAIQTPNPRIIRAFHDFDPAERPEQSEDCLFLNVTTPATTGKRPVLVYIHGGANLAGYSHEPVADPSYLIKKGDIVHVSLDFRTGIFGFLYYPGISEEVLNTLDQLAALHWVHDNITAFGGDPNNVTVIGVSSGAHNIVNLISNPEAKGLVHRAIIQSASFGRGCVSRKKAIAKAERIFQMLEIDPQSEDICEQLSKYSAQDLTQITVEYATNYERAEEWGYQWGAVHDDREEPAASAIINGYLTAQNGIHVIAGHTENEAGCFRPYEPEFGLPETERVFSKHLYIFTKAVNKSGGQAWAYNFGWCPENSRFKACHCIDQPFTYGTWRSVQHAGIMAGGVPEQMDRLTEIFTDELLSMIRFGHPMNVAWDRCTMEKAAYRYFDGVENPVRIKV